MADSQATMFDYYCPDCGRRCREADVHWNNTGWACCPYCYKHEPYIVPADEFHRFEQAEERRDNAI